MLFQTVTTVIDMIFCRNGKLCFLLYFLIFLSLLCEISYLHFKRLATIFKLLFLNHCISLSGSEWWFCTVSIKYFCHYFLVFQKESLLLYCVFWFCPFSIWQKMLESYNYKQLIILEMQLLVMLHEDVMRLAAFW